MTYEAGWVLWRRVSELAWASSFLSDLTDCLVLEMSQFNSSISWASVKPNHYQALWTQDRYVERFTVMKLYQHNPSRCRNDLWEWWPHGREISPWVPDAEDQAKPPPLPFTVYLSTLEALQSSESGEGEGNQKKLESIPPTHRGMVGWNRN